MWEKIFESICEDAEAFTIHDETDIVCAVLTETKELDKLLSRNGR